jgi:hypothetical protein
MVTAAPLLVVVVVVVFVVVFAGNIVKSVFTIVPLTSACSTCQREKV